MMDRRRQQKAILFDVDGTLYDSEDTVWQLISFQKKFVPELAFILNKEMLRDVYKGNFFEEVCRVNNIDASRVGEVQRSMAAHQLPVYDAALFPGFKEVLPALATMTNLAVVSSNFDNAVRGLFQKDSISDMFKIISCADNGEGKSVRLLNVLKELDVDPADAVYVCDTTGDVVESLKVGIKPVGVSWGFHSSALLVKAGAVAIIKKPSDLLTLEVLDG